MPPKADPKRDRAKRRRERLSMDNVAVQRRIEDASSFFLAESSIMEASLEKPVVMKPQAQVTWKRAQRHTMDSAPINKVFMSLRPSTPRHRNGAVTSEFRRESSHHSSEEYANFVKSLPTPRSGHDVGTATDDGSATKPDDDETTCNDSTMAKVEAKAPVAAGFNFFRNLKAADPVDIVVTSTNAKQAVDGLGLTLKDLRRLKKVFDEVDVEGAAPEQEDSAPPAGTATVDAAGKVPSAPTSPAPSSTSPRAQTSATRQRHQPQQQQPQPQPQQSEAAAQESDDVDVEARSVRSDAEARSVRSDVISVGAATAELWPDRDDEEEDEEVGEEVAGELKKAKKASDSGGPADMPTKRSSFSSSDGGGGGGCGGGRGLPNISKSVNKALVMAK